MGFKRACAVVLASLACALAVPALAAQAPLPAQVTINNSKLLEVVSKVNGHRYALSVGLPYGPPPKGGYPVLYVLDGDAYFASAVEAARANAPQVVVVGIGYPDDPAFTQSVLAHHKPLPPWLAAEPPHIQAFALERQFDLTPPTPIGVLARERFPPSAPLPQASDYGGVDDFLAAIEKDFKPSIEALVPIDRSNQALFGHSLGGLAVVQALLHEPKAFRTFIAASPSIWWGDRIVLKAEPGFDRVIESGLAAPRVLITVGGSEQDPPTVALPGMDLSAMQGRIAQARMVGNATDLAARLANLHGAPGYVVSPVAVFPEQAHGISPWPALGRAVSFAFPQN